MTTVQYVFLCKYLSIFFAVISYTFYCKLMCIDVLLATSSLYWSTIKPINKTLYIKNLRKNYEFMDDESYILKMEINDKWLSILRNLKSILLVFQILVRCLELYITNQHMSVFQFVRQNLSQSIILPMLIE